VQVLPVGVVPPWFRTHRPESFPPTFKHPFFPFPPCKAPLVFSLPTNRMIGRPVAKFLEALTLILFFQVDSGYFLHFPSPWRGPSLGSPRLPPPQIFPWTQHG